MHNFANQVKTQLDSDRLDTFANTAQKIIDFSDSQGYSNILGISGCSAQDNCADIFVDEMLPRAFRRPITTQEKADYREMFNNTDYGTADSELAPGNKLIDGMKMAMKAINVAAFLISLRAGYDQSRVC